MPKPPPWIVHHRDGWCALPPGVEPDPTGTNDPTLCGFVVTMRGGSKRGRPTCPGCLAALGDTAGEKKRAMTLTEIKRRLKVGQVFAVTNHREETAFSPVMVRVKRLTGDYGFYVEHALGETKVSWPQARYVRRDDDGTLHLLGTGNLAGEPFLTFVPVGVPPAREGKD